MQHRHFFRVADPKAMAEYETAPYVWILEWERGYGDSGIISYERSPEFATEDEARDYEATIGARPDFRSVTCGPLQTKPSRITDRCTRYPIRMAEAEAILGASAVAPPV